MKFEPCPFAEKQAYGVIDEEQQLNSNHFKYWLAGPAGRLPLMEVMTENADGSGYAIVTVIYGQALLHWGDFSHVSYLNRVGSRAILKDRLIEFRKYLAEQHALGCLAAGGVL
jgi:hypothetical protein